MEKHSKLGLVCKIVAAVHFGVNVLGGLGGMVLTLGPLGYGAWTDLSMWFALFLRLLVQLFGSFVPSLILWGVGTLLDQRELDRRERERIVKRLDGGEDDALETEVDTLEGFLSVDDLVSLDQPDQES